VHGECECECAGWSWVGYGLVVGWGWIGRRLGAKGVLRGGMEAVSGGRLEIGATLQLCNSALSRRAGEQESRGEGAQGSKGARQQGSSGAVEQATSRRVQPRWGRSMRGRGCGDAGPSEERWSFARQIGMGSEGVAVLAGARRRSRETSGEAGCLGREESIMGAKDEEWG
jgi:hypothetical protein